MKRFFLYSVFVIFLGLIATPLCADRSIVRVLEEESPTGIRAVSVLQEELLEDASERVDSIHALNMKLLEVGSVCAIALSGFTISVGTIALCEWMCAQAEVGY
jgi:hypothetical protein